MAPTTGRVGVVIVAIVVTVLCFVTGLMIGWFLLDDPRQVDSSSTDTVAFNVTPTITPNGRLYVGAVVSSGGEGDHRYDRLVQAYLSDPDPTISARLIQQMQAGNIERHLRFLSERPHLAGTEGDQRTVDYVKGEFQAMGYDVTLAPYDVLLSYPADEYFNKVLMLDGRRRDPIFVSGDDLGRSTGTEWESQVTQPYCMYSPSGKVQGKLIYANYGRPQDFRVLERLGMDINKAIVIMRYGKVSRGKKVKEAAKRGAKGVVLYNDPADVNINMTYNVYPSSWWLPGNEVEHGNIRTTWGDPATPGYPATEGAYRVPEKWMELPTVPCHPVNYNDARVLLQNLEGEVARDDWQGELGIIYRVGSNTPGSQIVEVDVKNTLETRRVYNVLATLPGSTEPDRIVLVGNHRDAVAYGALDPGSGTAVMLEIARAFRTLYDQGWRPRRTVIFCSWAAEEFGLIGSTEWVEEKRRWLSDHAVAYLNLDTVLQGNYTFDMSATPSLKAAGIKAAGKVPDPHNDSLTVLDVWKERVKDKRSMDEPWVRRPVSTTDFHPFVHLLGVPVTHSRYSFVEENGVLIYPIRNFPLYHTIHDTMHLAQMMDPEFVVSVAVSGVVAELTRDLADSVLLPLSPKDYADDIQSHLKEPLEMAADKFNSSVFYLRSALNKFSEAAYNFQTLLDSMKIVDPFEIQRLNDKLMLFEREFVDHKTGQHLLLSYGSNSRPTLDMQDLSKITQALSAAAASLTT